MPTYQGAVSPLIYFLMQNEYVNVDRDAVFGAGNLIALIGGGVSVRL
jgi:hypothetical protein